MDPRGDSIKVQSSELFSLKYLLELLDKLHRRPLLNFFEQIIDGTAIVPDGSSMNWKEDFNRISRYIKYSKGLLGTVSLDAKFERISATTLLIFIYMSQKGIETEKDKVKIMEICKERIEAFASKFHSGILQCMKTNFQNMSDLFANDQISIFEAKDFLSRLDSIMGELFLAEESKLPIDGSLHSETLKIQQDIALFRKRIDQKEQKVNDSRGSVKKELPKSLQILKFNNSPVESIDELLSLVSQNATEKDFNKIVVALRIYFGQIKPNMNFNQILGYFNSIKDEGVIQKIKVGNTFHFVHKFNIVKGIKVEIKQVEEQVVINIEVTNSEEIQAAIQYKKK